MSESLSENECVISLAPQSLSLRHKKRNFGSCSDFKSFFFALAELASSLCLPRALTAALTPQTCVVSFKSLPENCLKAIC